MADAKSDGPPGMADAPTLDAGDTTVDDDNADLAVVERERYQVGRELSRGGLGRVLYGHDVRLGRVVAIKQLLAHNPVLEARFRREARITARLQHPGIVPIYEAGRWPSGEAFYAMKLVTGRSLKDELGVLPSLDERLALLPRVLAVCDAMAYAHNEKVIHRDLKPANVMLGPFGEAYVVDWGLGKSLDHDDAESELPIAVTDDGLTGVGSVLGTPPYLPPEQARGEPVDARADVYALGALLYHVLLGRQPYDYGSGKTLERVLAGPPDPLAEREPGAPVELVAIVDKAMQREPADRYADAGELAADLRRFQTGQLVGAHRYSTGRLIARWIRRHRAGVIAAVTAIVAIAAIGTYSFARVVDERDAQARRTSELYVLQARHALDVDPTAAIAWLERHAAGIAPDATTIREIGVDATSRGIAKEVVRGFGGAAIASDGTVAGFDDHRRVALSRPGAPVEPISQPIAGGPIAIDSQARWIAWTGPDVTIYDVRAKSSRTLVPGPANALRFTGNSLAIGDPNGDIRLVAIADASVRTLHGHHAAIDQLIASPDGAWLASTARDGALWLWSTATATGRALPADAAVETIALSMTRIAWAGGTQPVRWLDLGGDAVHVASPRPGSIAAVALSADGHHLATGGEDTIVRIDDLDDSTQRTLGRGHTDWIDNLAFSPDGHTLVSTQSRGGPVIAWDLASGDPHALLGHDHAVAAMRFASDGTLVVADGHQQLRRWTLPALHARVVVEHSGDWPELAMLASGGFVTIADAGAVAFDSAGHAPQRIASAGPLAAPFAVVKDQVAIASRDGNVWLWPGKGDAMLVGHAGTARDLAFDGTRIAVAGQSGGVTVWTIGRNESQSYETGPVVAVAFDGSRLVTAGQDTAVRVWESGGAEPTVLAERGTAIESLAIGPGGTIAVGRDTGLVQLWFRDGTKSALVGHTAAVGKLAFVDATTLATGSADGTARVWELATGESRVLAHPGRVQALIVTGDGRLVTGNAVAPDRLATIRIWDLATAMLVSESRAHVQAIYQLGVTADRRSLVSTGVDHTVRVWSLDPPAPVPPANLAWLVGLSSVDLGPGDVVTTRRR